MGVKINVEPIRLEGTAASVEQHVSVYEKGYRQLFQEVDAMANGWQGKDNLAFVQQIKGFTSDFQQMTILMRQYADFLKMSAKAYRDTQDERMTQARRLSN